MLVPSPPPAPAEPAPAALRLLRAPAQPGDQAAHGARAPATFYARAGRPLLRAALLCLALPSGLLVGLPLAALNALQFGPRRVFFRQERIGRGGRRFWILKFRTMRGDGRGEGSRLADDCLRVTPIGRFLRSTHLDELPQLWNILRGEMDFIGPRPEMLALDAWARARIPGFARRQAVLPGVTGLAQITQGYAPRELEAYRLKLALDLRYLEHFSLRQDLGILCATALWMLRGRGWRCGTRPWADLG